MVLVWAPASFLVRILGVSALNPRRDIPICLTCRVLTGVFDLGITVACQLFLALIVLGGALMAPESPVLLTKKGLPEQARKSIAALRGIGISSVEMVLEYGEIVAWTTEQSAHENVRLSEIFRGANLRRQLLGMSMAILTIASGITFWFGYGTTFFKEAGVSDSYLISVILALVNAIFTALSTILVEKVGRRTCLLWGGVIMGIMMLIPAVLSSASPGTTADNNALIAGAVIFIAAYAATWGTMGTKRYVMMLLN